MKEVPLYRDEIQVGIALVDDEDYGRVASIRWFLKDSGYAYCRRKVDGKTQFLYMHRFVLGLPAGKYEWEVDHKNRNKLDNGKDNLRVVTHAQNTQNVGVRRNKASKHRGVSWEEQTGKWRALGYIDGKRHSLGRFSSEEEAAFVVRQWRVRHMPFSAESA